MWRREQLILFHGWPSILLVLFFIGAITLSSGHLRGAIYLNLGNIQLQKALFEDGTPTDIDWTARSCRYTAGSASSRGAEHLTRAVRYLELATAGDGNNGRAYSSLGLARLALGDGAGAREALSKAMEIEPACRITYLDLGHAYWELGRREEARAVWEQGGWLERFKRPYLEKAEKYLELGQYSAAEETIRVAAEIDPSDGYIYFLWGKSYLGRQEWGETLRSLQMADRLGVPDWAQGAVHAYLGHTYKNLGQPVEALGEFSKAVEFNPSDGWAWLELGHLAGSLSQWEEAIGYYREAAGLLPESAIPHFYLGKALRRQGLLQEAISELRKAVERDPMNPQYRVELEAALGEKDKATAH